MILCLQKPDLKGVKRKHGEVRNLVAKNYLENLLVSFSFGYSYFHALAIDCSVFRTKDDLACKLQPFYKP